MLGKDDTVGGIFHVGTREPTSDQVGEASLFFQIDQWIGKSQQNLLPRE